MKYLIVAALLAMNGWLLFHTLSYYDHRYEQAARV